MKEISPEWVAQNPELAFELIQKLQSESRTDSLTALPNRRAFDEKMKECQALSRRNVDMYAVLSIDLDNLKGFNDTPTFGGSACGDAAIKACGEALKKASRATDFVARFGGDDFGVILKVSSRGDVENITQKLRNEVEKGFVFNNIEHKMGISIGADILYHDRETQDVWDVAFSNMKADKNSRKVARGSQAA